MKYIKLFETYKTINEIKDWLDKYDIENYTINDDLTVDVDGNVNLSYQKLSEIPIQFRSISGYFSCSNNQLTSLEGCPSSVGDYFYCSNNQLTSLEGCPSSVGGYFDCPNNQLTSLKGCPSSVGGYFSCHNNQLTLLEGGPSTVGDSFYCSNNQLTSLKGAPSSVGGGFYCSYNQLTSLEGAPIDCMSKGRLYNIYINGWKFGLNQKGLDIYWEEQIENEPLVFKTLELNENEEADKSNQISPELYNRYKYLGRSNKSELWDLKK